MADSDPISGSSTPNKRRKLDAGNGKVWDSQDDSGDEFTVEDFHTVATIPVGTQHQRRLQYTKEQFHSDLPISGSNAVTARPSSPPRTYITQPTQTLRLSSPPHTDILVDRSSPPTAPSPPKPPPQPIKRAFSKPTGGFLASSIAPPGTSFRAPLGVQSKPPAVSVPDDSDDDVDPPVHHSSDDEQQTQGFRSNLKPTIFKKGGRSLDSTPNRVQESPRPAQDVFKGLLSEFTYSGPNKPVDDSISAYSSARRPRPPPYQASKQNAPPAKPTNNAVIYHTIDDVDDYVLRRKVRAILESCPYESVQRCMDALLRRHGDVGDAIEWLTAEEEQKEDVIEISSSPVVRRGLAQTQSSQPPVRPLAKQEVNAPTRTIAEKYDLQRRPSQPMRKLDESAEHEHEHEHEVKPRRRLHQGRKSAHSSPTTPQQDLPSRKQPIVVPADDDYDYEADSQGPPETDFERRLLKFFNDCSIDDLADLSAQPMDIVKAVLDNRPFSSLDAIRAIFISNTTKSGKKSKTRPIGEKIVELCTDMWTGYDAVDELVDECERLAKPIQDALRGWGVSTGDGELDLLNLDHDHDSGIGTPMSSSDDVPSPLRLHKGGFLSQPRNMTFEQLALKDFQLVGLNWLNLLWSKKISCILADDMGLGKTCQVIAFLAHLQQLEVDGVHLIIVPGSTLENWIREFHRFAPTLNVIPYYGSQLERSELQYRIENEFTSIDVIITTYDMAVKDNDNRFLRQQVDPLVCVFDEAHALRNPESIRYKQLTRIPATFRILLTGTPLQNNLRELVAILAFVMPKLFKEKEDELQGIFRHKASTKDENNRALLSTQRITRARSIITPFILRRKKEQVLELPAKHSRVAYCDMTTSQASYYQSLVEQYLAEETKTKSGSSNTLMALRKAAIHPLLARRLYDDKRIDKIVAELLKHPEYAANKPQQVRQYLIGEHHQSFKGGDFGLHRFCHERNYLRKFELKKSQWMDSGKIVAFRQLVEGFSDNDRILVFSQFTTMMDILEAVLETLCVKFMRLDGSTDMQIRQDMIDKFTEDSTIRVFMLSTKAGGAGINLACANKVIIFDSGFNPQDDIQAENRAHRVGQTREVEVIRLVTRGTIEEQIQALGASKLEMGERVAEGATAAEEKQAEKAGEQMVAKMFLDSLRKGDEGGSKEEEKVDIRDAFKSGLENAGVRVASKQVQF